MDEEQSSSTLHARTTPGWSATLPLPDYGRVARHSVIEAPDSGNAPRGGEVHIYCYRLLASLGQVHAYQTTSSDNMISIKPYMV